MRICPGRYVEYATVEKTNSFASLTIGILGFGKMERWVIDKSYVDSVVKKT
jgi:hypothetical protein